MTLIWLIVWAISQQPELHSGWLITLIICAIIDLRNRKTRQQGGK